MMMCAGTGPYRLLLRDTWHNAQSSTARLERTEDRFIEALSCKKVGPSLTFPGIFRKIP